MGSTSYKCFSSFFLAMLICGTVGAVPIEGPVAKIEGRLRLQAELLSEDKPSDKVVSAPEQIRINEKSIAGQLNGFGPKGPGHARLDLPEMQLNGVKYYPVILTYEQEEFSRPILENMGVRLQTVVDGYCTAEVPARQLEAVASLDWILNVEGARYGELFLDAAVQDTKVDQIWDSFSYHGSGIIVGVVDSGIDWAHEDFKDAQGKSRIQYLWDQSDDVGPNPSGYNYGSEWTKAQIDDGNCREQDEPQAGAHGTHVSGIAAGDGSATGNDQPSSRFIGVADQADLMFVKYKNMNAAVDGVNYMFQKAQAMGKPIAVNMSLGGIDGPHDGSTALESTLAGVLGSDVQGRALVIAAGNSGDQTIHARSTGLPAPVGENLLDYPHLVTTAYSQQMVGVIPGIPVEIYYPHGSTLKVSLIYPADANYSQAAQTPWVEPGNQYQTNSVQVGPLAGAAITIFNESPNTLGNSNLNRVYVELFNNNNPTIPIQSYRYYILLDGEGVAMDAWHTLRDMGCLVPRAWVESPPSTMLDADDQYTIARPGSMLSSICVGSHVTKTQWTDVDGQGQTQEGATLGAISGFSSRGKLRDETQKPDLSAPGEVIISVLAANYTNAPHSDIERDGVHQKMQGTSQESPHLCGDAALMLQ